MEIWKSINGYEGLYQISNLGRVKSLDRYIDNDGKIYILKGKIMSPGYSQSNKRGYFVISFRKKNKNKTLKLHRLIAEAFIPNPKNKSFINHINGIKTDNRVDNLEWSSNIDNMQHSFKIGLHTHCNIRGNHQGENTGANKLTEKEVKEIRLLRETGQYNCRELAKKFKVHFKTIESITRRISWKHI